nr:mitochondrial genome maintenance exonuclease 1 [Pogona vitticeps]XP_020670254.1 mitochondrial genome maintenance exonuclease 1 [Pogona vitticeps]XP_020670255.1 mitochondrial genome maintenance exonuclease 1 [Pogona vitticeps]XP_020670256.1 mitochondrial genome maintenance exonuclease 1 [Pogona vitticeps]XP_020670257.1 mitochondrial genome maintenance exonuclease 1 [Pogona vitticeps]XP_020670258.1 mitochondrial genome maintenance exonuclease 1 [Pogona vitticeps]XP_020670259.1 mitochondrial 
MWSFPQSVRKGGKLPELLNRHQLLSRFLANSSCLYGKKKKSAYGNTDQEKYEDLVRYLTSSEDSSQRSKSSCEEKVINRPGDKYKLPHQDLEPQLSNNWIPLMNPSKSSLPQITVPRLPLKISLSKKPLPSVTTVLQQSMSPQQAFYLERWKQQMILELGKEGFAEYTKSMFQQGKLFHAAVENLLLADHNSPEKQEEETNVSGFITSIKHVLRDVSGVRALESAVQHETLHYQGLVDCVAEYRGTLCAIDWKTSGKSKPLLQNTFDNPLQIAAYIGAINHDSNYNFQVDCGLLVIAYKDGSPAHAHYMDSELCSQYWNKWLRRLEEYQEKKRKDCETL